jgi:hypothetical protein
VDSRPGDRFTGIIRSDQDGWGLPIGTEVVGQVTAVRRASERQPGVVDVDITALRTPDGRSYPIEAALTSLDSKSVTRNAAGRLESRRSTSSKDRTRFLGYGAGAGAIIGALSGGDLLTSALLGAAAGYLYGELNKDKARNGRFSEVDLKAGTEFGVEVRRSMAVAVPDDRSGAYNNRPGAYNDRRPRYDSRTPAYDDRRAGSIQQYRGREIRVLMNEREVRFDQDRPFMSGGRMMVPLAAVLDAAGYRHSYDSRDREISVAGDRGEARLVLGENDAFIDGRRVRIDAPAQRIDGVLFVPVQFLEEATDIRSEWNAQDRTLRLTSRTRASLPYDYVRPR